MANPQHLAALAQGVESWNRWRAANPDVQPDLRGAGLNTSRHNLHEFEHANFRDADLAGTEIWSASLKYADLSGANLSGADLYFVDLDGASLRNADLSDTRLRYVDFRDADLSESRFARTDIVGVDLSRARGLELARYDARVSVDFDTFETTAQGLSEATGQQIAVETFYRNVGVPDHLIEFYRERVGQQMEFFSTFISHSHEDKEFARRLYEALRLEGVRCWLDEKNILPGDDIYDKVDDGVRQWDKILLCCSRHSLNSWWVDSEIATAFEKEQRLTKERGRKVQAIIPIDLDGFLFSADFARGYRAELRRRLAANLTSWSSDNYLKFRKEIDPIVRALRIDNGAREQTPKARL
jgi:hypothetical protein